MRAIQRGLALLALVILIGLALTPKIMAGGGIGLAPARIELSDAMRGGEYDYTLILINPGDGETYYTLGTEEGEAAAWVSYFEHEGAENPIEGILVPGDTRMPLMVRFNIPEDAANRTYEVNLLVEAGLAPPDAAAPRARRESLGGAEVMVRIASEVTIDVTGTQILTADVTSIMVENTEVNYPLRTTVHMRNTGNVDARPEVRVEAWQDGQLVREYVFAEEVIKPGADAVIMGEGDTTGMEDGEYLVNVSVRLGGQEISTYEREVSLFPVGTLTRRGDLVALEIEGEPYVGRVLRILGTFVNTGQIETMAQLVVEVYRDGSMIAIEEGREIRILPKQSEVVRAYYELNEPGDYQFKAHVYYEGRVTDTAEQTIRVTSGPAPQQEGAGESLRAALRSLLELPSLVAQGDRRALFGVGITLLMVALIYTVVSALNQRRKGDHSKA